MPKKWIEQVFQFVNKELKLGSAELTIVFMDQGPAQKLNHQFRKKNYATDILSFLSEDPDQVGELVICPQVVRRQAQENEHSQKAELAYLLIHGVLHLLGHEHEGKTAKAKAAAQKMYRIQDQLFDRLRDSFDL